MVKRGTAAGVLLVAASWLQPVSGWAGEPPPVGTMAAKAGVQTGEVLHYCLFVESDGEQFLACADSTPGLQPSGYLRVEEGERLQFRIRPQDDESWVGSPSSIAMLIERPGTAAGPDRGPKGGGLVGERRLQASLDPTWEVDLDPGRYNLLISADWPNEESADWIFGINVMTAGPDSPPLPRTGAQASRLLALLLVVAAGGVAFSLRPENGHHFR